MDPMTLATLNATIVGLICNFRQERRDQTNLTGKVNVRVIFNDPVFAVFRQINVLPLIYDEKKQRCNILVFDYEKAQVQTARIVREDAGRGRKHSVFRFYDEAGDYVCEVRYGDATANALQRGLWTHTKNGLKYFDSGTSGWIDYSHNLILVKLLPHILELARKVDAHTVLDGFSGTTRVAQALAKTGRRVIANDVAVWSEVFGVCYLKNVKQRSEYEDLIRHLNAVPPVDGWFTEQYGGLPNRGSAVQKDGLKKPWQIHNTWKLDGIRAEIDRLCLSPVDKAVALTSLILALDSVDSTLGHYVAYLQDWSPRSYKELLLRVPQVFATEQPHEVFRGDIFDLVGTLPVDLAYFDPPYGSNNEKMPPSRVRYASYYHLWTTVCLNDTPPLFGKARRRADSSDTVAGSLFEEFRRNGSGRFMAVEAIDRLIRETQARWIILSYSSGGRATAEELGGVLAANGTILETVELDYKRNVMAEMKWTNEWLRDADEPNREFLFLIKKT